MSVFQDLFGKAVGQQLNELARWVRDSRIRIIGFIIFLGIVTAILRKVDALITWGFSKLGSGANYIGALLARISLTDAIELTALFGIIWYLGKAAAKKKRYQVDLKRGISQWSIQPDTQWAITKDEDVPGKVLSVTKSGYPGLLKHGLNWYDYTLSFQAKIIDNRNKQAHEHEHKEPPNFTFVVRAKDRLNSVFFQCREDMIRPHLISDGIFVIDEESRYQLPFRIPISEWVNVRVKVGGDFVDIYIEKERFTYRIPTGLYGIPISKVSRTMYLKNIQNEHDQSIRAEAPRSRLPEEDQKTQTPENRHFFSFEFDRGTIGFREDKYEQALFRNIQISGIDL